MISNEEKINLLKIEGKRLVRAYESADMKENLFGSCPVCTEAERLRMKLNVNSRCEICKQIGIRKRCGQFLHLSDAFIGLACLLDPQYSRTEEIDSKKKIKELIFEVKNEIDGILGDKNEKL